LQTLNVQTIRINRPKRVRMLVAILASSVTVLLAAELFSNGAPWSAVPSIAKKAAPRPEQTQAAQDEEEQRIGDFMQKVARAHVGRLEPLEQAEEQTTDRPESVSERIDPKASTPLPARKTPSANKSERSRVAALTPKPAATTAAPVEAQAVPPAETKEAAPPSSLTSRVIDSVTGAVTSQNKRIMDGFGYIANAVGSLTKK